MAISRKNGILLVGSEGVIYYVNENFNAGGTPAGWSAAGGANYDYTATVLEGAQSCYCGGSQYTSHDFGTGLSDFYMKFMFRTPALPASYSIIAYLLNAATNGEASIALFSDGVISLICGPQTIPIAAMSANTTYYVWVRLVKGTGSNGVAEIAFDTIDSRPTSGDNFAMRTNAAINEDIQGFQFAADSGNAHIFDAVTVTNQYI